MSEALLETARRAHQSGNLPEAARLYAQILRGNAKNFEALYALGVVHFDRAAYEDARRLLTEAIKLNEGSAAAHFAQGCALQGLKRHGQALESFDRALALDPVYGFAELRRADALRLLHQFREAIEGYDRYLERHPDGAEAWHNRGLALLELKRFEEAAVSFSRAIALRPESAASWHNRGNAQHELKNFEEAARDYGQTLALQPDLPFGRGDFVMAKLNCCDWQRLGEERVKIAQSLRAGKPVIVPFANVIISESPADQLQCARIWMERHSGPRQRLWNGERYSHRRIRVAYLSADFRVHPVSILMAGMFEHHDRARFETIGVSFGPDDESPLRARVTAGFERFIDARGMGDFAIARLLREIEADIAVDLMGVTADCRSGIFAFRPAPVQVNYLGYPGTMAADFMDYIIADAVVIPEEERRHYSEKVMYLPDTYLPGDDKRAIATRTPTRAEAGLPDDGSVFCSFNNSYKFMPEQFAIWMRLLCAVDGSVLWLPESNAAAQRNLKHEAQAAGVAAERLVFAPHLASLDDHLARLGLADLFLDTLPCNAHTTASDALWAGLPLLTCMGSTFAGRVAASLLVALDLPELVTHTPADYEAKALSLARDPAALAEIRARLAHNRRTSPLFDTARFTRHLEAAYTEMSERARRGEPPGSFAVGRTVP